MRLVRPVGLLRCKATENLLIATVIKSHNRQLQSIRFIVSHLTLLLKVVWPWPYGPFQETVKCHAPLIAKLEVTL